MMEKPASWPFQVTFLPTGFHHTVIIHMQDLIVMERDEGSEYSRLYLLRSDGTQIEQITPDKPKVLYNFGSWFDDGSRFTYYSNERNLYFYDIYVYDLNKRSSQQIFSSDNSNYPSVISPDGKLMVISRFFASYDNDLLLYNLETNEQELFHS
jgi:Tol biopolymer transport system component